eukprot:TRINITY_DN5195_c0_g1_i1.p1 TRINITY_DN5195_c0_g1~~TRINITY_DN5195_c0_g1_i1.p1  ORF type:complete len:387 (-),score=91.78 TRINITY_DN5195_c0_g1_i1:151-1311(-)
MIQSYADSIQFSKARGEDPTGNIELNFLFVGSPGTGKTTVARKMGEVFYRLGILSTSECIETSASDLIANYVGQTATKTKSKLREALGKVLFIDEAYRLDSNAGGFAQEALDELVDALTKDEFRKKLVVILAGYTDDIERLLNANSGLRSRFPERVCFEDFDSKQSLELLKNQLRKRGMTVPSELEAEILNLFDRITAAPNWSNGRDITNLSQSVHRAVAKRLGSSATAGTTIPLHSSDIQPVRELLQQRSSLSHHHSSRPVSDGPVQYQHSNTQAPAIRTTIAQPTINKNEPTTEAKEECSSIDSNATLRDDGVSDQVWAELQEAIRREEDEKQRCSEEERKQKAAIQQKLRSMGVCPVGYRWIPVPGGYRCAGGSHFVTSAQLK